MAANQSEPGHLVCLQQKLLVITRLNEVHTCYSMLYNAIICNRFAQLQFLISVAPAIQTCLFLNKSGTPPTTPAISYKNSAGSLVRLSLYAAPCPWYPHLLIQNIQPSIEAKCPPVPRAQAVQSDLR